ncbi:TIM-barrel domain-containing protein [Olleya sp. UBA1516]|uniref:TIM-barrel domain-containing protein n=1 Tax=Olleya sp. UBA1516 TaxID=1947013 RepID=UPI0025D63CFE|nr:TIM-barrel domain-containing protein [Olleya sp. UBA1516]|tara:strand:+ start:293937 stop:297413 length:3477 start_codon:yes stop_codon:yes gene_type:complete
MKKILYILSFLLFQFTFAQVTIIVEELPKDTPKEASIFISGDFEGWSGGHKDYQLQQVNGQYQITLPKTEQRILFKFTLGNWETSESTNKGLKIDNRIHKFTTSNDTLKVKIAGWGHLFDLQEASTASKNVTVLSETFNIPQLNRKRRVWMYLPADYKTSKINYPVVYMHDGQNVFDASTSTYGEWKVDEILDKLFKENLKLIVVAVDNGESKRLDEYSPWTHPEYGGGEGEAYVDFIVNTLKPYIDTNFNTKKDKSNTAIFGSSMGGLISHYAALKYPMVFGKVGVYSPAFWFAPAVKPFTVSHANIKDTKMYFLAGGKEGENAGFNEISQTVTDMNSMISILTENGFPKENIQSKVVPEGKHNEALWENNFEEAITWLFADAIKKREFKTARFQDNQLHIQVSDGSYKMHFYHPEIIETTFLPTGEVFDKKSHAVVLDKVLSDVKFNETASEISFQSEKLTVKITKTPFHISYWKDGKEVTSVKNGYQKTDAFETISFNLKSDEVLYGGGARALGMNRRGNRLELYNKAHYGYEDRSELMNYTMPMVVSSNNYLIHFDNAPIGFLDLDSKADNILTYETISGRKTYQVVVGDSWLDLTKNYTQLTGTQPMPPRWALGNFSSRFGYHSQEEVTATVEKFREENIPLDAIIIDIFWFGKTIQGTMGNLAFDRDSFPNPKQMIKGLKDNNVKTVLVTEPFVLTTSNRWDEAVKADVLAKDSIGNPFTFDFYFGNTGLIDIYNPKGKKWFQNIYKDLANLGVSGVWGDLGEPEVHPKGLLHATGTADEVHNIYGHNWAESVQEMYTQNFPNTRPFILMRAGSSGSQRFGMIPWSGDVNRTWGGLQSQPEIALQMGMQGLAFMHSDLGGFAGNNLDDELYARWLQYGVFQPIYRPHAQEEVPAEPVFRSDKAKALAKASIELRYKLLPYNYNLVFENNQTGAPLMRALFFEEEDNANLQTNASTYLWGNDFLVTPIVQSEQKEAEVYFPKNSNWFDFYTNKKVEGGQTLSVKTEENSIPTYVRGGAFIPTAKPMQSTAEYDGNTLELYYYFDASVSESKRTLYNDDGATKNAFEKGEYEILEFDSKTTKKMLELQFDAAVGSNYATSTKTITVVIHNFTKDPKRIKFNRKKIDFNYNQTSNILTFDVQWNTSEGSKTQIKY